MTDLNSIDWVKIDWPEQNPEDVAANLIYLEQMGLIRMKEKEGDRGPNSTDA